MDDLVRRLTAGSHPIEVSLRPNKTVQALKDSLERGLVLIRFTETRGGTELGVPIDETLTDSSNADFEHESGTLKVVGSLTLNDERVRCVANIDLPTLKGSGRLEVMP